MDTFSREVTFLRVDIFSEGVWLEDKQTGNLVKMAENLPGVLSPLKW